MDSRIIKNYKELKNGSICLGISYLGISTLMGAGAYGFFSSDLSNTGGYFLIASSLIPAFFGFKKFREARHFGRIARGLEEKLNNQ